MSKANQIDVTTRLLWEEEDALQSLAKRLHTSAAGAMRLGLYALLEKDEPQTAKKLIRMRLARQQAAHVAILFFALTIPLCALPARRPSRNGMMARTAAHAVRKTEVGAV